MVGFLVGRATAGSSWRRSREQRSRTPGSPGVLVRRGSPASASTSQGRSCGPPTGRALQPVGEVSGGALLRPGEGSVPARVVDDVRRGRRLVVVVIVGTRGGRSGRGRGFVPRGGCGASGADRVPQGKADDPGPLVLGRCPRWLAVGAGDPSAAGPGEIGRVGELVGAEVRWLGWGTVSWREWRAMAWGDVVVQAGREGATAEGLQEVPAGLGQEVAALRRCRARAAGIAPQRHVRDASPLEESDHRVVHVRHRHDVAVERQCHGWCRTLRHVQTRPSAQS